MCRPTPPTDNAISNVASSLEALKKQLASPRDIAIARMHHLGIMSAGSSVGSSLSSSQPTSTASGEEEEAGGDGGLPMLLVSLLEQAAEVWTTFYQSIMITKTNKYDSSSSSSHNNNNMVICNSSEVQLLQQTIALLSNVSTLDPTLGEEISRAGSQPICNRIIDQINKCTTASMLGDGSCLSVEDSDALIDLQDVVFEIYSPSFGKRSMAYSNEELRERLPLVYDLTPVHGNNKKCNNTTTTTTVFINQVTKRQSAQADVGYVMWPSAIILSRWLLSNPTVIQNKSVLELGAGCALVGITAARIVLSQQNNGSSDDDIKQTLRQPQEEEGEGEGQAEGRQEVIITDVNELVLENISQNIKLNDAMSIASVAKLDFYTQTGTHHTPGKWIAGELQLLLNNLNVDDGAPEIEIQRKPVDVILAADIICQPEDAIAASKTIFDALKPNGDGVAYIVCANAEHRFGVEIFAEECIKRGLIVETTANVADMYDGQLMTQDMESATGYVDGMELTFFKIVKQ